MGTYPVAFPLGLEGKFITSWAPIRWNDKLFFNSGRFWLSPG